MTTWMDTVAKQPRQAPPTPQQGGGIRINPPSPSRTPEGATSGGAYGAGAGYGSVHQASAPPPGLAPTGPRAPVRIGANPTPAGGAYGRAPGQEADDPFAEWLRQYYEELSKGVDFNDPRVQSVMNQAGGRAMNAAKQRGIQGPLQVNQGQQAYTNAAAGLMEQQQARRAQVLGMGMQNSQFGQQLGQQRDQFGQTMDLQNRQFQYGMDQDAYQRQMAQWQYGREQSQGFGAGLGTVLGGVGGGLVGALVPGMQPFIPQLIAGGASVGGKFGAGMGGMGGPPPPQFRPSGSYGRGV